MRIELQRRRAGIALLRSRCARRRESQLSAPAEAEALLRSVVLRSASTCLLIVMALLWYISDGTKLHFGREAECP